MALSMGSTRSLKEKIVAAARDGEGRKELRLLGEEAFGQIVDRLNDLFPEGRTQEAWEQICVALELYRRMAETAQARAWHNWAAETLAEHFDGFTEEFLKKPDDELRAGLDRLIEDLLRNYQLPGSEDIASPLSRLPRGT